MKVTLVYCNDLSAAYLDKPQTYQDPIEVDFETMREERGAPPEAILERIYTAFNRTDGITQHPLLDERGMRSMSMGDVVILGGEKYRVATVGFEKVEDDLIFAPAPSGRDL